MRPLNAADLVTVWDQGRDLHPLDRALLLLAFAWPDRSVDLPALTLGQRNGRLLRLRRETIGERMEGLVHCPQCAETLEFELQVADLLLPEPENRVQDLALDSWQFRVSLPTSADLADLLSSQDLSAARSRLIERCLLSVREGEAEVAAADLPAQVVERIGEAIAEADPLAEMRFSLRCHACGHEWLALFDIVSFFWSELEVRAKKLLLEVHQLARAYGWREAEILALSPHRRRTYLEFLSA